MVCDCYFVRWVFKEIVSMSEENLLESTELVEMESTVEVDSSIEILTQIQSDVRILVVFTIITFVMSCLRGWRKNVVKGV